MKMVIARYDIKNCIKDNTPVAVALGFFDSLHKGHCAVIESAKSFARKNACLCAVFTFDNNPFKVLGKDTKLIYTFPERCEMLKAIGVDLVLAAAFEKAFMDIGAEEFLDGLTKRHNVKYISCGSDYTFGRGGAGKVADLSAFCAERGLTPEVSPEIIIGGQKVSSTRIRAMIAAGDVAGANELLCVPYCVWGRVGKGRGVGGRLMYPTANTAVDGDKQRLGAGVYATNTYAGGKKYLSVTSAGPRPTFSEDGYGMETHIIGDNPDLYGEYIKVEFIGKIRDIARFRSPEELKQRIGTDIEIRKGLGN